jgi:hypothetical protein
VSGYPHSTPRMRGAVLYTEKDYMAQTWEQPEQPLQTAEEELNFLRAQVEAKEKELASRGTPEARATLVHERILHHKASPSEKTLAEGFALPSHEAESVALNLAPQADDETMEELRGIMETKGIKNALSVLDRMQSPHLEDDFHRFLVQYVMQGIEVRGLKSDATTWKALHMTLYEITLPETPEKEEDERSKYFKELISSMEQFYAGMLTVEEAYADEPPYFTLELAVPTDAPHLRFYASIPNSRRDLFEKQILAIFPNARISIQPEDYNVFADGGTSFISVGKLAHSHPLSLKDYTEFDYDPMNGLLNAFDKIQGEGEGAAVQIIIRPRPKRYNDAYGRIVAALKRGERADRAFEISGDLPSELWREFKGMFLSHKTDPEHAPQETTIKSVEKKRSAPITETNIRIVSSSENAQHAELVLKELEASFNVYEDTTGNKISFKRLKGGAQRTMLRAFSFRLFSPSSMMPLSTRELTTLYHFPPKGVKSSPHLSQSRFTAAAAPLGLGNNGIHLGSNDFRGSKTDVYMDPQDRLRHLYVIGQTGTGKSGFLQTMIEQDMKNGEGLCFIDPHGKDVIDILGMVPPERYEDVIYFDPAYLGRSVGLNMLEYDPAKPEQKSFIVNELLMIFRQLYGDVPESMGPMFEQYFRAATQLVMEDPESGSTMMDISRVFADPEFRMRKLAKSRNLVVNQFWNEIASKAEGESSLQSITPYITNKFDEFTANDFMRPIMGQQESSFNFRDIIDNKKIFLVNLSKGRLGERNANLIGLILVGKLFMAALSRADSVGKEFPPFYLYIDEFQNITTSSISGILSEARKYKLSLTIAHQFLKQIDEKIRDAVFGNVGSMAVFRVGEEDGEVFEKQFAPTFKALDFVNIENRNAYIRLLAHGVPQKPFNIKTRDLPAGNPNQVDDLRELSYLTYGRDREMVENAIRERYLS